MGTRGRANSIRGTRKSPRELKRGFGVAGLLREYCGQTLLSGPAFWKKGSRASVRHVPRDLYPRRIIPIPEYIRISWYWILLHFPFNPVSLIVNISHSLSTPVHYSLSLSFTSSLMQPQFSFVLFQFPSILSHSLSISLGSFQLPFNYLLILSQFSFLSLSKFSLVFLILCQFSFILS